MSLSRRVLTVVMATILVLATAGMATAQTTRFYLASYMGLNVFPKQSFSESTTGASGNVKYKNAISFAGALGFRLNRNVRIEGELSYRDAKISSATVAGRTFAPDGRDRTALAMANLYYDFASWHNITPFVTAGLGGALHDFRTDGEDGLPSGSGHSLGFAYQAGAGLSYRVTPTLAFTGDYKYVSTTDVDTASYKTGWHSHEFRLGLQYDLPVGFLQ